MTTYKCIEELTEEELLEEMANLPAEPDKPKDNSDVETFIQVLRLKPGYKRVPFSFLYNIYKQWSWKPTRRSELGAALQRRFKRSRSRYEVFYWLDNCGLPNKR